MDTLNLSIAVAVAFIAYLAVDTEAALDLIHKVDGYLTLWWGYLKLAPSYLRMRIITYWTFRKMRREFQIHAKPKH